MTRKRMQNLPSAVLLRGKAPRAMIGSGFVKSVFATLRYILRGCEYFVSLQEIVLKNG